MKNLFKRNTKLSSKVQEKVEQAASDSYKRMKELFMEVQIESLQKTNKNLKAEVELLRKKENHVRDLAALSMFTEISKTVADPEKAAEDSFRSADAFMRVRDKGKSYQEDILEKLKEIVTDVPENNEEIGARVKMLITKY